MCNTEDCLHYDYVRLAWDVGFTFEEYDTRGSFDISVIGLVDVEKVAKERDIPTVVKHIPTLLQFRLDNDFGKVLEPNFIKLFRLSQLSIQYLIFCKKYLDSTVALMKSELVTLNNEKSDMEIFLEELKTENDEITCKYEELKATLSTSIFKCEQCAKTFYSEEYLLAHIRRRHQVHNIQMQTEADKLQLEIKELKQRLNNTERLILKDEDQNEKGDVISPKERAGTSTTEKEKELESVEPNNDAIMDNSIQFKFEQLKNHIETEINSLKDEDFYKSICEKYIKERVEKSFSGSNQTVHNSSQTKIQPSTKNVLTLTEDNDFDENVELTINKGVESFTQTDCKKAVSEGTSMSPKPKPRKLSKSADDTTQASGPSDLIEVNSPVKSHSIEASEIETKSLSEERDTSTVVMRTIEEKLAKEAELQRETLEHILDLKLSGSLDKMEAQMTAFWQKLNAWESNLTFAKSTSVPSVNVHSEFAKGAQENGEVGMIRQTSLGSLTSGSPINKMAPAPPKLQHRPNVPKALPRSFNPQKSINKSPVIVLPKPLEPSIVLKGDVTQFLDSSDEEDVSTIPSNNSERKSIESKTTKSSSESTSEEEPSNIKPTDSFKKHLDETLLQRLNPHAIQTEVQTVVPDVKHPPIRKVLEKTIPKIETRTSPPKNSSVLKNKHLKGIPKKSDNVNKEQSVSDHNEDDNASNYKEMKKRLKRHVEESVNQKLKDIGVSPHWKCLPEKSYTKAMEIVEHQATLSKKSICDFHKIRKNIERAIDKEMVKPNETGRNDKKSTYQTPSPMESREPSEGSIDIPLQRIAGQSTLNKTDTRRGSFQSQSSNSTYTSPSKKHRHSVKSQQLSQIQPVKTKAGNDLEVSGDTTYIPAKITKHEPKLVISTAEVTAFDSTSGMMSDTVPPSITKSLPSNATQNQKKKVLFDLDSNTEQSEQQSPVKQTHAQVHTNKDLSAFVQQEKSKLDSEKQGKPKYNKDEHLNLHTGSESSDWDISDIT